MSLKNDEGSQESPRSRENTLQHDPTCTSYVFRKKLIRHPLPHPGPYRALSLSGVQGNKSKNERKRDSSETRKCNRDLLLVGHFIGVAEKRKKRIIVRYEFEIDSF